MDYIIVQAGGKGSRLEYLTKNKPKALVPIENLPMIFHLFNKFPEKKFVIIADYKKEVLREYLACFAKVKYQIVDACGTGTCAGIAQAMTRIPDGEAFMLVWSDLILPRDFSLPDEYIRNGALNQYIGISKTFSCRWSYQEGSFEETPSMEHGVAGFFLFTDKSQLANVPQDGELVRWMQQKQMNFREISLAGTREFGLLSEYNKLSKEKCRPFNSISISGNVLTKTALGEQGEKLAQREVAWYEHVKEMNFKGIPRIYGTNPLKMELIQGENIYECDLEYSEKREILQKIIATLKTLHGYETASADSFSLKEAYYNKTISRIAGLQDLIPFARDKYIIVNGRKCRNIFYNKRELEERLDKLKCDRFCFIHGDCTFSNLMLRSDGTPVLIDPRGYFGHTELLGDERYDWAKLYYSVVGNYDKFNLKDFRLSINENSVELQIESNHWEDMEKDFFEMTGADPEEIRLIHAVIWLSLTTYAWQDYDSVCGAFYNGLYYLEEVL